MSFEVLVQKNSTFSDNKPGENLIKNQYLPGVLISYPGLFHVSCIKTSQRLHIKEYHRKKREKIKEK